VQSLLCAAVVSSPRRPSRTSSIGSNHSPAGTTTPSGSAPIAVGSTGRVRITSGWTTSSPGSAPRSGRLSGAHRPARLGGGGRPRCRMLDECDDAAGHESCGPHRRTRPGHLADLDEATASRDLDSAPGASRGHLECPRIGSGVDNDFDPITLHTSTMRPTRTDRECPPREEPPARPNSDMIRAGGPSLRRSLGRARCTHRLGGLLAYTSSRRVVAVLLDGLSG
jgi:hypothetical protein